MIELRREGFMIITFNVFVAFYKVSFLIMENSTEFEYTFFIRKWASKTSQILKKMLRKSPAANAWAKFLKTLIFPRVTNWVNFNISYLEFFLSSLLC